LIAVLTLERGIARKSFGATTFRIAAKAAGSEPDECFYFGEIESVKNMEQFDPRLHRAPDLWIEVDIFSPSVAREPIYARLGVPEVWRYGG
jgi:Uma2 family endonuclease